MLCQHRLAAVQTQNRELHGRLTAERYEHASTGADESRRVLAKRLVNILQVKTCSTMSSPALVSRARFSQRHRELNIVSQSWNHYQCRSPIVLVFHISSHMGIPVSFLHVGKTIQREPGSEERGSTRVGSLCGINKSRLTLRRLPLRWPPVGATAPRHRRALQQRPCSQAASASCCQSSQQPTGPPKEAGRQGRCGG